MPTNVKRRSRRPGQALIAIVVFGFILFIFVGIAIDAGMLYLERRQLQNVADAACLAAATEISINGVSTASPNPAVTAASNYVLTNMSASAAAAFDLNGRLTAAYVAGPVGTGTGLSRGIEVSSSGEVRVAVNYPAYTYFLRLAKFSTYNVMARARCNPTNGGGVWPVAVVRFPAFESTGTAACGPTNWDTRVGGGNTGKTLPQYYTKGKRPRALRVRDILQAACNTGTPNVGSGIINEGATSFGADYDCSSIARNWYDWPARDAATLRGPFHEPCKNPTTGVITPNANYVASDAIPGYPVTMVGSGAQPNVGVQSFTGPLMLDVRDITTGPNYYNGQTGSTAVNRYKDLFEKYIRDGYPGPDVKIGQQIGILNGVSAGLIIRPIADKYKVGDKVWTLVYDGTVARREDFSLALACTADPFVSARCDGNYVYRSFDATPVTGGSCKYDGSSFLAVEDGSLPFDTANLKNNTHLHPAEYTITLGANNTNPAAATIWLTARPSGTNAYTGPPANGAGNPEAFANLRFRWIGTNVNAPSGTTPWQSGDVPVEVNMPIAGSSVKLQVVQDSRATATTCASATGGAYTLPNRVSGVQSIEVTGRSGTTQVHHSAYGFLGMEAVATGSNRFTTNDFFFNFPSDPVAEVTADNTAQSLNVPLSMTDANSDNDFNKVWTPATNIKWYKLNTTTGLYTLMSGAPGTGTTVTLDTNVSGGKPSFSMSGTFANSPSGGDIGFYAIDMEVEGSMTTGSTPTVDSPFNHSTRFYLRIKDGANPSIDEWVYALCYARFQITTIDTNYVDGRAVSGCLPPEKATKGMTGRLSNW